MQSSTWAEQLSSSPSRSSTALLQSSLTINADRAGRRHGVNGQRIGATVGGGVGCFGTLVQPAESSRHSSSEIVSSFLVMAFQLIESSRLNGRVAGDGLPELPHLLLEVGDCADLTLLISEHAGLQIDQLLSICGLLLCAIGAIGLSIDAWGETPPGECGAGREQQNG